MIFMFQILKKISGKVNFGLNGLFIHYSFSVQFDSSVSRPIIFNTTVLRIRHGGEGEAAIWNTSGMAGREGPSPYRPHSSCGEPHHAGPS